MHHGGRGLQPLGEQRIAQKHVKREIVQLLHPHKLYILN